MSLDLRPDRRRRRVRVEDQARRAALVDEYYRLVSTHPSHMIASRPTSAASNPVTSREPVLPSVVRASTPFDSLRSSSRPPPVPSAHVTGTAALGASTTAVIPSFTDEVDHTLADYQPTARPPSSILTRSQPAAGSAPVGRLVCMYRDQPVSYYNSSPVRRATVISRMRAAVLLQRSTVSPGVSMSMSPPRADPPRKPTPTERLNALLRCSSRSQI
jgi:hypothetical protein